MSSLLLVFYVGLSLFPLAAGAGLHQYFMGANDAARSTGGVLLVAVGGACAIGYIVMLKALRRNFDKTNSAPPTWGTLTGSDRLALLAWPVAFVAGFVLTIVAAGQQ